MYDDVNLAKPLVGGASAIAIGAAIGTSVVSDKGIDLNKVNSANPGEVWKSVKSLDLPDIKSLKAPVIPSGGISFPKFEGLPSVSAPKLPEIGMKLPKINIPNTPDFKLPEGIKMPDVPFVSIPGADRIKDLGSTASKAVGNVFESNGIELPRSPFAEKTPEITTYGQGPYQVPMPYLDRQVIDAENQLKAQEAAESAQFAEKAEAARIQQIREETEAQVMARQTMQRERDLAKNVEYEERIKQDADARVRRAEEEAARLRAEVEQTRLVALEKEKAAAEVTARLKKEAEAAFMKEQAAKEEFTQKLQKAELAKLKEAQDFSAKFVESEASAAKARILEEQSMASRQAISSAEVRKTSIGATAARKASYPSPSMSTYQAWQERQRAAYQTNMASMASTVESKSDTASAEIKYSVTGDNLSTYQRWQQNVAARQVVSASTEPVKAAYITGAPAPVANQLVSGTTKLSEAAVVLNGDLGYVIAGAAAVVAGITYGFEKKIIEFELSQIERMKSDASESVASTTSATVKPIPPIVPPSSAFVLPSPAVVPPKPVVEVKQEVTTSVTMAIDSKDIESSSVTKVVPPPPPTITTTPGSVNEAIKQTQTALNTPEVSNNQRSYLESMSSTSDGNVEPKSSYSPFSNVKKTGINNSLYNPPSTTSPRVEEEYKEPPTWEDSSTLNTVTIEGSYLDSMSGSGDSLKSSYSPFSNIKKMGNNDSLYNPPSTASSEAEEEYEETHSWGDSGTSGESYLESMSGSGESLKASYSSFGTSKTSSNDSLYAPPDADTNSEGKVAVNGGSYLDSMSSSNGNGQAPLKASYSPFGTPKVTAGDSLYGPPDTPSISEEASTSLVNENSFVDTLSPPLPESAMSSNQGSYLNALNGSSGSNLKMSYAPFGRKPKVVDDSGLYSPGNSY